GVQRGRRRPREADEAASGHAPDPPDARPPGAHPARLGARGKLRLDGARRVPASRPGGLAARRGGRRERLLRRPDRGRLPAGRHLGRGRGPAVRRLAEAAALVGVAQPRRPKLCAVGSTALSSPASLDQTRRGSMWVTFAGGRSGRSRRSILSTITFAVPSRRSRRPEATTSGSERTARRKRSWTGGGMIRLIVPSSSSRSMKVTPLAVAGRWR